MQFSLDVDERQLMHQVYRLLPPPGLHRLIYLENVQSNWGITMDEIATEKLRALLVDCRRVLNTVCERVADRHDVSLAVRDLMSSTDLLPTFLDLARRSPELAEIVLQASIAALSNSQSVMVVEAELRSRASKN